MPSPVSSLACGRPHPDYGWTCNRMRNHDGAHMAAEPDPLDGKPRERYTWADFRDCCDTYPGTDHMLDCARNQHPAAGMDLTRPLELHDPTDTAGIALDPAPLLAAATDEHLERIRKAYAALLVLAVLVGLLCAPALVIAAWRWALS